MFCHPGVRDVVSSAQKYGNLGGRTVVETLFVDGLPHGWYGDADGQYAFSNAPDTAQLAWQFFKSHPRPNCTVPGLPVVVIKNVTPDNASHRIRVDGTLDGPVSGITVKVELLGLSPQPAQAAEVDVATKSFVYLSNTGLPDNTYYRPLVTVTDSQGNMVKALGSPVALGAPIVPPPALTIEDTKCSQEHVSLVGTVRDDTGVTSVEVRFDGKNWLPAVVSAPNWSYDGSGLPEGTHAIDVRAMSKAALDTIKSTNCPVLTPYDAKQQSDLAGHVTSSRIRFYPNGFGSADKTYMELYQEHGLSQQFWLYRARNTKDWYDEIGNIPVAGAAKTPSTPSTPSTSAPPQFPVRGFGSERRAVMPCCP
jgi:hypothetical protein